MHAAEKQPIGAVEAVEASLARIEARDYAIRAWAHLGGDFALSRARSVDGSAPRSGAHGWTVGIKDVIETSCVPTSYGSAVWKGNRPWRDAAVVRFLTEAGAIIVGKTTTAEFAAGPPPSTRNPHDSRRTPGSSSSGSAAAVADGHVRVSIGTQTAGSTIRPASFCGVYGFKPTFDRWPLAGVQQLAPSFDTLSAFSREVDDLIVLDDVLAPHTATRIANPNTPVRLGIIRTWHERAAPEVWKAVEQIAADVSEAAGPTREIPPSPVLDDLDWAQALMLRVEASQTLAPWTRPRPDLVSAELRGMLEEASATAPERLRQARSAVLEVRNFLLHQFADFDILVMPSSSGEAPIDQGLPPSGANTGDPIFSRLASAAGCPAVSVPAGTGPAGMPLGVQFLAKPHHDRMLLSLLSTWTVQGRLPTPPPIPGT